MSRSSSRSRSAPRTLAASGHRGRALARARRLLPNLVDSDVVPGAGHFVSAARPDLVDPHVVAHLRAELRHVAAATT